MVSDACVGRRTLCMVLFEQSWHYFYILFVLVIWSFDVVLKINSGWQNPVWFSVSKIHFHSSLRQQQHAIDDVCFHYHVTSVLRYWLYSRPVLLNHSFLVWTCILQLFATSLNSLLRRILPRTTEYFLSQRQFCLPFICQQRQNYV